jgi:hypothetical protein
MTREMAADTLLLMDFDEDKIAGKESLATMIAYAEAARKYVTSSDHT